MQGAQYARVGEVASTFWAETEPLQHAVTCYVLVCPSTVWSVCAAAKHLLCVIAIAVQHRHRL